jgi:hypothetical protein
VAKGSREAQQGDRGLVVVGASVTPLTLAQREELEAELEEEAREELLRRFRAHGRKGGAGDEVRVAAIGRAQSWAGGCALL